MKYCKEHIFRSKSFPTSAPLRLGQSSILPHITNGSFTIPLFPLARAAAIARTDCFLCFCFFKIPANVTVCQFQSECIHSYQTVAIVSKHIQCTVFMFFTGWCPNSEVSKSTIAPLLASTFAGLLSAFLRCPYHQWDCATTFRYQSQVPSLQSLEI